MKQYDVIIIGAGPGGIYSAWEMAMKKPELKIAVFEKGRELEKRKCPINGDTVKNCVGCPSCAIMSGFGGAGAFPMVNTTLPMNSAEHCMNTLARRKPWN